jgi:hypothetical protein
VLSTIFLLAIAVQAQTPPSNTIVHHSFESDEHGWKAMGGAGGVRVAKDAANRHDGMNSLAFDYSAGKEISFAILPVEFSLEKMKSLRFWLKTDVSTAVGVLLSEKKPGGDYACWFWSPKDRWQQIVLTPADFTVNDGPNDPKDPDGRLDLDQVQGIGVIDLKIIFNMLAGLQQLPFQIDQLTGSHTLLLNDFQIQTDGPEPAAAKDAVVIDDFKRPFARWLSLGGMEISLRADENPAGKPSLEASYRQTPGKFALISHRIGNIDLSKCDRLSFDIASRKDAQIAVSIEMVKVNGKGARYTHMLEVAGEMKPHQESIPFAEFVLDENSPPDPAGKFDPARARTISLLDVTSALGNETLTNTLWLADVRGLLK